MPGSLKTTERKTILANLAIGLTIASMAAALIWVAFNCIDSLQHNSEAMRHYTGRTDFSIPDPGALDLVQTSMEEKDAIKQQHIAADKIRAERRLATPGHKPAGSEINFTDGLKDIDKHKPADAVKEFTEVLKKIPEESKHQNRWQVLDWAAPKRLYKAFAYQQRAHALLQQRQYKLAVDDLTEAIKLRPEYARNFENRAKAYQFLGNTTAAEADLQQVVQLKSNSE